MLAVTPMVAIAAEECTSWAAKLASLQGRVEVKFSGSQAWETGVLNAVYCPGASIRVGANSRAAVVLPNETLMRLDQNTVIKLTAVEPEAGSFLNLLSGIVNFISRVQRSLKIETPYVNASIEGTEFVVAVKENQADITVFEGTVLAHNPQGELRLTSGESATAIEGQAPIKVIVVRPRDAVQWALYYPPVVDLSRADGPQAIGKAATRFAAGDLAGFLAATSGAPPSPPDADFFAYRASLLLYVGRVDEAEEDIARALAIAPDQGVALALRSVAVMSQNQTEEALRLAQEATRQAPDSAAPHIALSYAHQARFNLEAALREAEAAVELAPKDALAHARVAELQLAQGSLRAAEAAAEVAVQRNPNLARTQTVLGFAYLLRLRLDPARERFEQAIALDSADPLPRLGLGLARIRLGQLAEGREEIEIATGLDPTESLVRSYLGKAYYEEKRGELAASQYAMAKELDPQDPTPWFYDAILKQTTNRPVEALEDMQAAIERNDNRAVYRSKLALDSDLAARSASQARIFKDLGFDQLGLNEGALALAADPGEWAAHRFLADAYAALPRQDISRASALLTSQLLQPVNATPLQPQLAETNIPIVGGSGPSRGGLNEFNPLYLSNGMSLQANGVGGSNSTWGDDLVVAGLYGPFSISAGQFHYETDGFRENNDLTEDIYDIFAQWAITPRLNVQAEFRHRESDQGDLDFNFDLEDFSTENRLSLDQDTARLGLRYAISSRSDVILSYIDSQRDGTFTLLDQIPAVDSRTNTNGRQAEAQYLYRADRWNLTAGFSAYDVEIDSASTLDWTGSFGVVCPQFPPVPCTLSDDSDVDHRTGYAYLNTSWPGPVTWTLGVAYDDLQSGEFDLSETKPKLGVQWALTSGLSLRAAYLETVQRTLTVKQSIEPVQVAGFNQFYDQDFGTEAEDYALAVDVGLSRSLSAGVEVRRRNLDIPEVDEAGVVHYDRDERLGLAYVYWAVNPYWALNAEATYADIEDETGKGPERLKSITLPVGIRYFARSGLFGNVTATYVRQEVDDRSSSFNNETEDFTLVDVGVGYRLPRRLGILSLNVHNLFDQDFRYQDLNYITPEPVASPYIPERTVFGRVSLSF